jgi:hypothetical protein
MEACGPSGWTADLAKGLELETVVCSTNEDAWKWANVKRKTDKDDALKLARMASMDELKAVHLPTEAHREFRSLVKYRKTLDCRICKMKCTIRAWFVNHGISIATGGGPVGDQLGDTPSLTEAKWLNRKILCPRMVASVLNCFRLRF